MATIPSVSSGERERAQALLEMGFDATQALLLAATLVLYAVYRRVVKSELSLG